MLVANSLKSNIKPNLLSIEKNINKILNEIKSFNHKTSHQNILKTLQNLNSSPIMSAKFSALEDDKNTQNLKDIFLKLKNLDYYKKNPKDLKNIQREILNLSQKSFKSSSTKKDILQLKNEIKNFSPNISPKKIANLIDKLQNSLSKMTLDSNISTKNDIKDILNKLEKIDFYKNDPKTLSKLKEKLSNPTNKNETLHFEDIKIAAKNMQQKVSMLLDAKKDTPQIKEFIKNIENLLKSQESQKINIQNKLQELQKSFDNIKNILYDKNDVKDILNSIQKDIKNIFQSLNISPKHKEFEALIKDTLLNFKTGKIKLLSQIQIIKNIGNITKNIDNIISNLPNSKKYIPLKTELLKFSQDIKQIDLKQNITNSGILYESKLFERLNDDVKFINVPKSDIKGILLSLKNDTNLQNQPQLQNSIQNTLSQINAIQTNAILSQNFTSYIPFSWDDLKDGYFSISKLKKEDGFSCKIELDLNKYGKIDVLMLFHHELLSMKMDIKNKNLESILKKESSILQQSLKKLGFETSIFFSIPKQNSYISENSFSNSLDMDIKV